MTVQIENGFRYPLSRFRTLMAELHRVLTPLGDVEAIRMASELCAIAEDSPTTPWETLKLYAPRYSNPPVAVPRMDSPAATAIDLVYQWSDFGLHRNVAWSMYDASIRVDMWTLDGADDDAQYVYGRLVASSRGLHEALITADGFEDYSYWDEEDPTPEWEARKLVWNRLRDNSLFGWTYRPSRVPMMKALKDRY